MYINKKFLDFMFSGQMHYQGQSDSFFMVREPQGVLVVTKGRLVLADPYAINYGVFSRKTFRMINSRLLPLLRI